MLRLSAGACSLLVLLAAVPAVASADPLSTTVTSLDAQKRDCAAGPASGEVLTRREIEILELVATGASTHGIAERLHVSPATVSRWFGKQSHVGAQSAEGQLAKLLLRVFRSLDTLVGGQPEKAKAWLRAPNHHLGAVPQERLRTVEGLVHVAEYLDAMRGTV